MSDILRQHAEQQTAEELHELKQQETHPVPDNWQLSPQSVVTYLIGSEISLLDCCVLPILWRLESLEIELPKAAATIQRYMDFHFSKDYFRKSLSKQEAALRPGD